jgi:hypothetical protein
MALNAGTNVLRAQESILGIVRQNNQKEQAAKPKPRLNTTSKVDDGLKLPENNPDNFGAKPSTRPQYVTGLRGLRKQPNTAVTPKKPPPSSLAEAPAATAPLSIVPPQPGSASGGRFGLGPTTLGTQPPGLPPIITPNRKRIVDDDPYAPDGLRLGNIKVLPFAGFYGGFGTNAAQVPGNTKVSPLYKGEAGLSAQSDWTTNALSADLRGAYLDFPGASGANQPEMSAKLAGRLDIRKDLQVDGEVHASLTSESVSDPNLPAGTQQRPLVYTYGTSAGVTEQFARAYVNLRTTVDRYSYDPVNVAGAQISQSDRDETTYGLRLRAGYEVTPGISPFADTIIDTREFDQKIDVNGFDRHSNGYTGRLGSTFQLTGPLTGEIALGYGTRQFSDQRLKDLSGAVGEASLIYSISPLTAVRIKAVSDFQDSTTAGASGIVSHRLSFDIEHALFRNLTLGANAEIDDNRTVGAYLDQLTFLSGVRADYKLTKEIVLRTSYTFQRLYSSLPGNSYSSSIMMLGLRVQR